MEVTISHRLPGRLRIVVEGIRDQSVVAYQLQLKLMDTDGIRDGKCNADTGRALIQFDESRISAERIVEVIKRWMSTMSTDYSVSNAVAATVESDFLTERASHHPGERASNPYLIPSVVSAGTLGVLSLKRLLMGRSAIALSPLTFWAAAGVSIAVGYPILRQGIEQFIHHRKATPDLWIGLATLGMAAIRENLVALSVITALNVVMYRRHDVLQTPEDTELDPDLERYSRRMTRLNMWVAPLTLLITRSPLRAVGVALAANPRPAFVSHKYRWAETERRAYEKDLLLNSNGGLSRLAAAKSIVFTDEKLIRTGEQAWSCQPVVDNCDEGKATAIAASLLKNCEGHPWREALLQRAIAEDRTIHTAFDVQYTNDGVRGRIQGHDMILGTRTFVSQCGIDNTPILMVERRMRRQGFQTQILVVEQYPIAVIGCKRGIDPRWQHIVHEWEENGYRVRTLENGRHATTNIAPVREDELIRELQSGTRTIVIGDIPVEADYAALIRIGKSDLERLPGTLRFCRDNQREIHRDISIVKSWNVLGTALALATPLSAPLIALSGDVVSMLLLAIQGWRNLSGVQKSVRHARTSGQKLTGQPTHASYYALNSADLLHQLSAGVDGLSTLQVMERQRTWGANALPSPDSPSVMWMFLSQFKELSMLILLGTTGLSFVMGEQFSALCMMGILAINACVSTWQEKNSMKVIQRLKIADDSKTKVIRDGVEQSVPSTTLVPGDVVLLEPGDKVPADIRLFQAWNLEVNEAMFTGESLPVVKRAVDLPLDTPLADRVNCLFMGTIVTRGRCKGIVVATGSYTEMGAVDALISGQEDAPTFLQTRVNQISKQFVIGAFIAAGVVAAAGLLRGIPPMQLLIPSVTLAASAIPEGLPLTITVALTAGVLQMSKRRAVTKKLANLESLGRVTVICCDKTGTLTKNEMTVKELATVERNIRVIGNGYMSNGNIVSQPESDTPLSQLDDSDVRQLLTVGLLCNNARLDKDNQDTTGDPTEVALLQVAAKAQLNDADWRRHREIPFDSVTRSMSVVCEESEQVQVVCEDGRALQKCTLFSKGAVEAILKKCTHYVINGEVRPMSETVERKIREENARMANEALRVLAFAYRLINDDEDPIEATDTNLIYVGLMGMLDPPKEGIAASIAEARRIGIKPVMITGDHPLTARAIGAELGMFRTGDRILTGQEIDGLVQADFDRVIVETSIFARVSPEHKLRIVEAFQRIGDVVAMTGDGMNDAPAIRKADVGIAMGLGGTDIAKGNAGIVLMEDHFHTIVDGVKRGRVIIGNIRKAIGCLLAGNLAEVLVTAVSIMIGLPMPLIPMQILLMNILTDAVPAMVLATGSRTDVPAAQPYKDVVDKTLYRTVLARGCVLGFGAVCVFAASLAGGIPLPHAQTMTYAAMIVGQLLQTASWRKYGTQDNIRLRSDRVLLSATLGSGLALVATIYMPGLRTVFATVPLGIHHWGIVLAVTGGLTWVSQRCIEWWSTRERTFTTTLSSSDYPVFALPMGVHL